MAHELNMESKHSLEKAAALQADCFTTVSEVTARECAQLLGRKPDVVTPNGFEADFVPGTVKLKRQRAMARAKMLEVASALTGNEYADDTFLVVSSGRCEYRNKGLDLFLDSIARLGDFDPEKKVLAFIMVPAWVGVARPDLVHAIAIGSRNRLDDPFITHTLRNYDSDPIIGNIHRIGFANAEKSKIDIIYVPCYLNGDDGLFDMTYYELLPGFDASVFPSYYEPWGYTPLESVAFGVPTVTTSLSGFGQWVLSEYTDTFEACGVRVEKRNDSNYEAVRDSIARDLNELISDSQAKIVEITKAAMHTAADASWSHFIKYYCQAYAVALNKADIREKNKTNEFTN